MTPDGGNVVELNSVRFGWTPGGAPVLDIDAFCVGKGERIFLHGPSGSGKSTLLGLIAGVSIPESGEVRVLSAPLHGLSGAERDRFRADHLGVVFQLFNLIPYLSVLENVVLPCGFSRRRRERAGASRSVTDEARRLLRRLGMDDSLLARSVTTLSVGQQQRVAAARALIGAPELVVADEPTSALDAGRRAAFVDLLLEECGRSGSAIVFVSHDRQDMHRFDRSVDLVTLNHAVVR
ncbi:MAG: ABC transporter ATP-binding protein [Betaproteobacteria bacterium]|jgi:putative ABC transport system ATP-binding protein